MSELHDKSMPAGHREVTPEELKQMQEKVDVKPTEPSKAERMKDDGKTGEARAEMPGKTGDKSEQKPEPSKAERMAGPDDKSGDAKPERPGRSSDQEGEHKPDPSKGERMGSDDKPKGDRNDGGPPKGGTESDTIRDWANQADTSRRLEDTKQEIGKLEKRSGELSQEKDRLTSEKKDIEDHWAKPSSERDAGPNAEKRDPTVDQARLREIDNRQRDITQEQKEIGKELAPLQDKRDVLTLQERGLERQQNERADAERKRRGE